MGMTESKQKLSLDDHNGLRPYLRAKGKGMPQGKVDQIAWLLLNGSGCGFCEVCRDEPCLIKDGEYCTTNIANYIRKIVLEELEKKLLEDSELGELDEFQAVKEKFEKTVDPDGRRKVLFTNGMHNDRMLVITDAPKPKIEAFCRHLNQEMENGENTYFDFLKKDHYVNVLFDSEYHNDHEDIDIIGYDEAYDFGDFQ